MTWAAGSGRLLPESVRLTLDEFCNKFDIEVRVVGETEDGARAVLFPEDPSDPSEVPDGCWTSEIAPRDGPTLTLQVWGGEDGVGRLATVLKSTLERLFDFALEVRFFTYELSERYEEINLLYSISETLGSILRLEEAAGAILTEVCDVLGAQRGALWVHDASTANLVLKAAVGMEGHEGPIAVDHPDAVTAQVFREGRPLIGSRTVAHGEISVLSVPIRYTPPSGDARTVGVMNLIGRRHGGRFTASDQKLLSAIASQVGAALENNRLIRESLAKERMSQEMALAHNLQMKLLQAASEFDRCTVGARVVPAEQVGGDFYNLFKLSGDRIGVMIGDVSTHGFPAALIMALSLSASSIYAMEYDSPAEVLRRLDDALRDELETTEMYVSMFYGIIDPAKGDVSYSNAGHPHAFAVRCDGAMERLLATDPPLGIAGPDAYHEESTAWNDGDLMFLFTDGLSDTLASAERGGEPLVLETVSSLRDRSPMEIVDELFRMAEAAIPEIPSDDRTAIVLRT